MNLLLKDIPKDISCLKNQMKYTIILPKWTFLQKILELFQIFYPLINNIYYLTDKNKMKKKVKQEISN